VVTPGGGGWGDPLARDPDAVLRDVRDGFVTLDAALADYGVVVVATASGSFAVDRAATERARAERRR
jgi:N-methylhydantoinase B